MAITVSGVLLAVGVAMGVVCLALAKPLEGTQSKANGDDVSVEVRMPHVQPTVVSPFLAQVFSALEFQSIDRNTLILEKYSSL